VERVTESDHRYAHRVSCAPRVAASPLRQPGWRLKASAEECKFGRQSRAAAKRASHRRLRLQSPRWLLSDSIGCGSPRSPLHIAAPHHRSTLAVRTARPSAHSRALCSNAPNSCVMPPGLQSRGRSSPHAPQPIRSISVLDAQCSCGLLDSGGQLIAPNSTTACIAGGAGARALALFAQRIPVLHAARSSTAAVSSLSRVDGASVRALSCQTRKAAHLHPPLDLA
jgi:hypothetical protein